MGGGRAGGSEKPLNFAMANQLDSPVEIGARSFGIGATSPTFAMETHIAAHASAGRLDGMFLGSFMGVVCEPTDIFMVMLAGSQH